MRGRLIVAVLSLALLGLAPVTASAQTFLTPMAGATFANDAPATKFTTGLGLAFLGKAAGLEVEFGYTPDFFNQQGDFALISDSNLSTFTGSLLVGLGSGQIKPYGALGFGLMRSRINDPGDVFGNVTTNDTAINIGGGAFVMLTDHVGLRGDLRYFRSLEDPSNDNDLDVTIGKFDYWRGLGTVTFRF